MFKFMILLLSPLLLFANVNSDHLREAFAVAKKSRDEGSHPFGAVLVYKNEVFLTGTNKVEQEQNPLKHAEIVVLENYLRYAKSSEAERKKIAPHLKGQIPRIEECQIYTSTQPCQMCEGAIYTMKVGKELDEQPQIVFGLDKDSLSEVVRGYRKHDRSVTKSGPHLLDEAKEPHEGFWR